MAYWKDTYEFNNSIEYEFKYAGRYGAKGEKRSAKSKPTPEQQAKVNQEYRKRNMRHLIKANFFPDDIWATLKYPKGTRIEPEIVKKNMKRFLARLRKSYKDMGEELKFIYRMEVGSRGGIHIHILLNRARGRPDTGLLIQEAWDYGRVNYEAIYESGGYKQLAEYIVKQPDKRTLRQISFFEEEYRDDFIKYSSSRNLIRPEPERKTYLKWTLRDLIDEGPKPTPGYYIDPDSIEYGINAFTGMSYYRYSEIRIKERRRYSDNSTKRRKYKCIRT